MSYENNVTYTNVYAGIKLTFSLENLSQKAIEKFNMALVEGAERTQKHDDKIHA